MKPSVVKRKIIVGFTKYFVYISIGVVLAVLGTGYVLFIKDTLADINEIGVSDLEGKEQLLIDRSETLTRLKKLEKRYADLTYDDVRSMQTLLPRQDQIPSIVIELKSFLLKNGLDVKSIDVGPLTANIAPATAGGAIQQMNIIVVVGGLSTYANVKQFLDEMTSQLPLMELRTFSYNPASSDYTLNLTTYYQ
ncbi:MAG: type 4a pilus biogenesis protein PilO [Patescibacteria group bacterium]|nr:type 4a pilus biogenesis protein PilO [Patescibacteria group bacterium]MDD5715435.1 type 4a pilus biogenesis protein PilO [Patescibacteria group bacterium]